ncbi:MAG: ATP-binding protein, partial [Chlamydiia bacterium]|nr:ATP-binding protein [Chlamydiia bacterium]
ANFFFFFFTLNRATIVEIVGGRRAGNFTLLVHFFFYFIHAGVNPQALLHINFEEPTLASLINIEVLDTLYETYRARVYPEGRAYIFLDEVQNVKEWERWARARNESENIKIILTGSSSELLSRELGTLLTGRHLSFEIYPLSFREVLEFRQIDIPTKPWPLKTPPRLYQALLDYAQWGGMPRVILSESEDLKERLLKRYFEDMLYRDVINRHQIRDVHTLRNLAVYLLTQTASLISFKRLCDLFSASQDLIQSYCQYLHEAFLIDMLPLYTLKTGERTRNPLKAHAIDLGLRNVVSFGRSTDQNKLIESMVYHHLLSTKQDGIFYWQGKGAIDLLVRQGMEITHAIQVTHSGLENPATLDREQSSLQAATKAFPDAQKQLIALDFPPSMTLPKEIELIPLWHLLLS